MFAFEKTQKPLDTRWSEAGGVYAIHPRQTKTSSIVVWNPRERYGTTFL